MIIVSSFCWLNSNSIANQILLVAGLGLTMYAGLANSDVWKEFYRYFRESKYVSIMTYYWKFQLGVLPCEISIFFIL